MTTSVTVRSRFRFCSRACLRARLRARLRTRIQAIGIIALAACALSGCAVSPPGGNHAVHTFAAANSEASGAVMNAFMQVNEAHYAAQGARFLRNFDRKTDMPEFTRFISQESIDTRARVFEQLALYSAALIDLSGDDKLVAMDDAIGKLGAGLASFQISAGGELSGGTSATVQSALNALGRQLIERRRSIAIKAAAAEADPHVQAICSALLQDMATLMAALRQQNAAFAADQYQYLRTSLAETRAGAGQIQLVSLNLIQKRGEIQRVADLTQRGMYSEDFLYQLTPMIKAMAEAHAALAATYQNGATPRQAAEHFLNEVRRVKALHAALRHQLEES